MKKCILVGIAAGIFVVAVYWILCFRSAMRVMSNAESVVSVDYAVGQFLNCQREFATNGLANYIESNYPNINVKNGVILDKNGRPMRISINNNTNTYYISVSSSGKDGLWGTRDDVKREGYLENNYSPPVVPRH